LSRSNGVDIFTAPFDLFLTDIIVQSRNKCDAEIIINNKTYKISNVTGNRTKRACMNDLSKMYVTKGEVVKLRVMDKVCRGSATVFFIKNPLSC
jgi:hypothetical protein